jgi:hypothetical protein
LRPLWGENSAVAVSLLLQFLLKPSAHPFPAFGFYFQFQLPQRRDLV